MDLQLSQEDKLSLSIKRNDISNVEILLGQGANPTIVSSDNGQSAIAFAARKGLSNILRLLLLSCETTEDPHYLDNYGRAPIHYAAMIGNAACVELLLQYNSPVDLATDGGETALHCAFRSSNVTRCLLKRGANPNHYVGREGTPLHAAAKNGTPAVVKALIEAGTDMNATCHMNRTALMLAIDRKKFKVANVLIDSGADVNTQDSQDRTPLSAAVFVQSIHTVKRLLQRGAQLFTQHHLLHYCVREDLPDMIKVLVKYGDDIDVRDTSRRTPLLIAITRRNIPAIKFFIKNGAKLSDNPIGEELYEAITQFRVTSQFKDIVQALLFKGVDLNCVDHLGESPLSYTIKMQKYEMTEYLIMEGADVNILNKTSSTFHLNFIRKYKTADLIKLLFATGLKTNSIFGQLLLANTTQTPLSLQESTRISIRNAIMEKMKNNSSSVKEFDDCKSFSSMMKYYISTLTLPTVIETFLCDFPDVPHLKNPIVDSISNIVLV